MKVLVTGANGFIGQHLSTYLTECGHHVLQLGRAGFNENSLDYRIHDFEANDNKEQLSDMLKGMDAVVHLLGVAHLNGATEVTRDYYFKVNVGYSENIFEAAAHGGVTKFIYISSVKAYGEKSPLSNSGQPIAISSRDEDAPESIYGESKRCAEEKLKMLAIGLPTDLTILRLPLVYGVNQKGNLEKLFRYVREGIPLPFASVKNSRSLISVKNVCDAINSVLIAKIESNGRHYYLDDTQISTPELITLVANAYNKNPNLVPFPVSVIKAIGKLIRKEDAIDKILGSLIVDSSEFCRDFNWLPPKTIREVIHNIASAAS